MADGHSLSSGCVALGVHISTVLNWLSLNAEWDLEYERLKTLRSRALMEMALGEVEQEHDSFTMKVAEARARTFMRVAALLNPKEFSDKMHTNAHKQGSSAGRVSFTLNFGGAAPALGESVTVTVNENEE
jgi:hypothetical protein